MITQFALPLCNFEYFRFDGDHLHRIYEVKHTSNAVICRYLLTNCEMLLSVPSYITQALLFRTQEDSDDEMIL